MPRHPFPILQWLPQYKREFLKGDMAAGITVGILLIPQGLAYALLAGLPPVYGLYAALTPQVVYALMGSSRQLAVGPVAMDSLLVASGLAALSISGPAYVATAIFLAFFMGGIQLFLGVLRMGFLVNFLSGPVISGFTSAAAVIIGLSQLKHIFGIHISGGGHLIPLIQELSRGLGELHPGTAGIGLSAVLVLLLIKKFFKKIPGALVLVGIGTFIAFLIQPHGVEVVGVIPAGLPEFRLPNISVDRLGDLLPLALTLALVAFMEAISVAKAIEEKAKEDPVHPNQELIALGASNMVGSLFQSYPVTGGFSRTAVNQQSGARTGIAALISAGLVALVLLFLTPVFYFLPQAVLAAIILVAVIGLVDIRYPGELLRDRRDEFGLWLTTLLVTLLVGMVQGILFGVLFSLLLLVYRTSRPHIAVLGRIRGTQYFKNVDRFGTDTEICEEVLVLRFDGQLYFGNQEYFRKELFQHIDRKGTELKYVILNAEAINYADSSAVRLLRRVIAEMEARGLVFLVAGAIGPLRDILYSSGLVHQIRPEHLFVTTSEAFDYCQRKEALPEMQRRVATQSKKIG